MNYEVTEFELSNKKNVQFFFFAHTSSEERFESRNSFLFRSDENEERFAESEKGIEYYYCGEKKAKQSIAKQKISENRILFFFSPFSGRESKHEVIL